MGDPYLDSVPYFEIDDFGAVVQKRTIDVANQKSVQDAFNDMEKLYARCERIGAGFRSRLSDSERREREIKEKLAIAGDFILMLMKSIQSTGATSSIAGTSNSPAFWIEWNSPKRTLRKLGEAIGRLNDLKKIPIFSSCLQYEQEHLPNK